MKMELDPDKYIEAAELVLAEAGQLCACPALGKTVCENYHAIYMSIPPEKEAIYFDYFASVFRPPHIYNTNQAWWNNLRPGWETEPRVLALLLMAEMIKDGSIETIERKSYFPKETD